MIDCKIKLESKLIKPGSEVLLGPYGGKFKGEVYRTTITLYGDGTSGVLYDVQWWDDKVCYKNTFFPYEVEEVNDTEG